MCQTANANRRHCTFVKIEVHPEYINEYMKYAVEVGEISLRTEPGVLTMYAVQEKRILVV